MSNSGGFIEKDKTLKNFEKSVTPITQSEEKGLNKKHFAKLTAPLYAATRRTTLPKNSTCNKCGASLNR